MTARVNVAVPKQLFFRSTGKAEHLRRPFLSVYYKSTKTRNETHFDTTQSHKWLRLVEKVNYNQGTQGGAFTMYVQLPSLTGDEWYAVYASITSNVNTIGLFSPIVYFRTLPRQPEPILNLRGESLTRSTIELMWQAPTKPNGPIAAYLVYYAPIDDRLPVDNSRLLCLMKGSTTIVLRFCFEIFFVFKDRWQPEEGVSVNDYNLNQTNRCNKGKFRDNDDLFDNFDDDKTDRKDADQIVTDLSILEYQLINSVSQRKDPLFIRQELKDTIINDLDHYFEDKSSAFNDQSKTESQEQPVVEHKPYINDYNRSVSTTKIIITNLREAQMYMFQVYACHDIRVTPLSDACSINGIITTVRTKPGHRKFCLLNNNCRSICFFF